MGEEVGDSIKATWRSLFLVLLGDEKPVVDELLFGSSKKRPSSDWFSSSDSSVLVEFIFLFFTVGSIMVNKIDF